MRRLSSLCATTDRPWPSQALALAIGPVLRQQKMQRVRGQRGEKANVTVRTNKTCWGYYSRLMLEYSARRSNERLVFPRQAWHFPAGAIVAAHNEESEM